MRKFLVFTILFITILFPISASAYDIDKDTKIYVSGETIGIKVDTGVMVAGTFGISVDGKMFRPWENANIVEGDYIISFDDKEITSTKTLLQAIAINGDEISPIIVKRKDKLIRSEIDPVRKNDNSFSLGLYIKDEILGVGTLTYIIPTLNKFGSLGHSISNTDVYGGTIYEASVDNIIKSNRNHAGEKRASIIGAGVGDVKGDSITGVYGTINSNYNVSRCKLMNFKPKEEVELGSAKILTVLNGSQVEAFDIEITKLSKQNNKDVKGIKFKVTDERLLNQAGGIVQGMSGSPIIQDNAIIGAVTHVIVSNPSEGYGVYIEFMFADLDIYIVE